MKHAIGHKGFFFRLFLVSVCLYTASAIKGMGNEILLQARDVESGSKPPLLVFLHGRGSSPATFQGLFTTMVEEGKATVFLPCGSIKMGTRPDGTPAFNWDPDKDARAIIKKVKRIKGIDRDRIYLVGFSAGANMAYIAAFEDAHLFAGIIPISGGLQENFLNPAKVKKAPRGLPFYIIHGTGDRVMSVELGRQALNWLQARGFRATLEEFDGGHRIPAEFGELIDRAVGWIDGD